MKICSPSITHLLRNAGFSKRKVFATNWDTAYNGCMIEGACFCKSSIVNRKYDV